MIKRIMTYRVAAAAFAASALIVAPAVAAPVRAASVQVHKAIGPNTSLVVQVGSRADYRHNDRRDHRRVHTNQWGQTDREVARLSRNALQACRSAITREAYRIGYRDVDFDDDRRVRQIGPNGFEVRYDDVEFERGRRDVERNVTCTVRRGNVAEVRGIPALARGNGHGYTVAHAQRGRRGH
jgi:hypothetical protein